MDLSINLEQVTEVLCAFIRNEIHRAGFGRAVVGLSGGLDSSTVTYLAARALAPGAVGQAQGKEAADGKGSCKRLRPRRALPL